VLTTMIAVLEVNEPTKAEKVLLLMWLTLAAAARQLELLDDVGDLLEAVHVVVLLAAVLRYDEKRHALKQNNLADMV
jgi:hypothetical protein